MEKKGELVTKILFIIIIYSFIHLFIHTCKVTVPSQSVNKIAFGLPNGFDSEFETGSNCVIIGIYVSIYIIFIKLM